MNGIPVTFQDHPAVLGMQEQVLGMHVGVMVDVQVGPDGQPIAINIHSHDLSLRSVAQILGTSSFVALQQITAGASFDGDVEP